MVAPLSKSVRTRDVTMGTSPTGSAIAVKIVDKSTQTQKYPYNLVSFYVHGVTTSSNMDAGNGFITENLARTNATNLARKRFVGELGQSSQFGSTMTAELRKTWGTVVDAVTRLLLAARAVKKYDLVEAGRHLGFSPPEVRKVYVVKRKRGAKGRYRKKTRTRTVWRMPTGREVTKDAANKWLWYSYGVKPLVEDVHNGMAVLLRDPPSGKMVKGSGTAFERNYVYYKNSQYTRTITSKVSVRFQARVSMTNPNLWLANQLGLVNPVQMFNEGIPFSFVVDWFSNLSDIIGQMTDFVGLHIAEPCMTVKIASTYDYLSWYPGDTNPVSTAKNRIFIRDSVVPVAKLRFGYERFQWQRGANAISLLVGLLKKSGPTRMA